jgi:hypothetical protein
MIGMAARREDVDLWLVLTDPKCARKFIEDFDWNCPPEYIPDRVVMDTDRVIFFDKMDDSEAVVAAMELLRSVQIPIEMREKQIHEDLGEIH